MNHASCRIAVDRRQATISECSLKPVSFSEGSGLVYSTDNFIVTDVVVEAVVPENFRFDQPYPNPFNSSTQISFGLPTASHISLEIYDISGRNIATLINAVREAGTYSASWRADDVASGIYWVSLKAGEFQGMRKVVLLR